MVAALLLGALSWAQAQIVPVADATALRNAINNAAPGHEIVLAPGVYMVDRKPALRCRRNGWRSDRRACGNATHGDDPLRCA
ncbi:MAG: hypothetical protein IPH76_16410 [Xanthomonadales bacterium]|nr:hypothetical protein [Xanthomonadales bacterium]